MTGSDAENKISTGIDSSSALNVNTEALLREKIAELDRLIAMGLRYTGGATRDPAARPAEHGERDSLREEVVRREQIVAALEEVEARRHEVRELKTGSTRHGRAVKRRQTGSRRPAVVPDG